MRSPAKPTLGPAALVALLAAVFVLAQPSPPKAHAVDLCGAIGGGVGAITGGLLGEGNPVGDACGAIGGALRSPLTGALRGIGAGIFAQITSWVSEGSAWLIGKVVGVIERSTTPRLTSKGFVSEYARMAAIAALLGTAALLVAVLEGLAQGNVGSLARAVLVNLPLAFLATSVAYVIVQMALVATDGLCEAVSSASGHDGTRFFEAAIAGLGKAGGKLGSLGGAGAAGEVAGAEGVPLFVGFLAAFVGALAAFVVWIELLMRDAAVYVVSLFLPLSFATSISPRWSGVLRRTAELLIAVIGSKFVIVSIVSLAAGLLAQPEGRVEPILAASALMLLACFAPFVLLKFVAFAEGAMGAAYGRRSAAGGASTGFALASDAQILRNAARHNWQEKEGSGVTLWSAGERLRGGGPSGGDGGSRIDHGGGGKPAGGGTGPESSKGGGRGGGATPPAGGAKSPGTGAAAGSGAGAGSAAASPASAAAAAPSVAARGSQAAARRLGESATAKQAGAPDEQQQPEQAQSPERAGKEEGAAPPGGAESPPRPKPEGPGLKEEKGKGK